MKKIRNALFGLICMTGLLSACGESPMAPSADVPLTGAEWDWSGSWNKTATTDTTSAKGDKDGPTEGTNSGYILGM